MCGTQNNLFSVSNQSFPINYLRCQSICLMNFFFSNLNLLRPKRLQI